MPPRRRNASADHPSESARERGWSPSDQKDIQRALEQLRCVLQEIWESPEGILPPDLRADFLRAYPSIDECFDELIKEIARQGVSIVVDEGDCFGVNRNALRMKLNLLLAAIERYRDARLHAGLAVRRTPREDPIGDNPPPNKSPAPTRPNMFQRVRTRLARVTGTAAPVLGSLARALREYPLIAAAAEGVAELCDYVSNACDLDEAFEALERDT
jgi:hypothetical protein